METKKKLQLARLLRRMDRKAVVEMLRSAANCLATNTTGSIIAALLGMLAATVIGILLGGGDGEGGAFAAAAAVVAVGGAGAISGASGEGRHVVGEPLTTAAVKAASPELLQSEVDRRIVKVRPMSTPLDQISRYGGARHAGSMKVEYYAVDTKPSEATVTSCAASATEADTLTLATSCDALFPSTTTILVPGAKGAGSEPLVLYVEGKGDGGTGLKVRAANAPAGAAAASAWMPKAGDKLVRMGRAAGELDVMTPQYEALPTKNYNYCQIFKAQVEQSTLVKLSNKEVGWTFSDQEEAAIIDMRMCMERNFLLGHRARLAGDVMLTGGIWNQTDHDFTYKTLSLESQLVRLCKEAFAHNAGSTRKILLAGSDLIEAFNTLPLQRIMHASAAVTKWGLDFTEIHSKFGTLYVLLSEVFDQCGMAGNGMVIDPEYIAKYSHLPFRTERLDLRASGLRNTDAVIITEASCLVLRYPRTHMRIIKEADATPSPDTGGGITDPPTDGGDDEE